MKRSVLLVLILVSVPAGLAPAKSKVQATAPEIRLLWLEDGYRTIAPERDLWRIDEVVRIYFGAFDRVDRIAVSAK
jgi:hypothetical protein